MLIWYKICLLWYMRFFGYRVYNSISWMKKTVSLDIWADQNQIQLVFKCFRVYSFKTMLVIIRKCLSVSSQRWTLALFSSFHAREHEEKKNTGVRKNESIKKWKRRAWKKNIYAFSSMCRTILEIRFSRMKTKGLWKQAQQEVRQHCFIVW